ncbi:hypothetical protein LVD15_18095 [Fulvivirga maritima]|uniref:hypothetical protein n=1 Tax=Fulvivirga maritima TaxID=2904247 RepID=UPI001F2AEA8D|nr:hypothetical protein [Fulvivirga maritima]UII25207.1 hypothetical protein LVD15_18095 [Fulvivirga maritima]
MELDELLQRQLISKKIYHPIYGEIGSISDILTTSKKYIVFKERSLQNLTSCSNILRAIPASSFYIDTQTNELMVNFSSQWITEAPKFTLQDLESDQITLLAKLDSYYDPQNKLFVTYS